MLADTIAPPSGLMRQFLDWIAVKPRTYDDTMNAWRTSCPRLSVWEDALLDGLVTMTESKDGSQGAMNVVLTEAGHAARSTPT